ncbi:hypothetical protein KAR91_26550 [Candidatus Pacearchaeota archaeon]|nr:hypothetical protein [Candidatus Pacearchaeota archaeon]
MSWFAGIPVIGEVVKTIFGSKLERDRFDADAKAATSSQFAAEFGHGRNWFDSLVDGLNRLPRPVFAFGTIYLFVLCWTSPEKFVAGAVNLELMPQEAWWILGTIVVFFFGGRLNKDFGKYNVRKEVLQKHQAPSSSLKTPTNPIERSIDVASKKRRHDWDGLN